MMFFELVSKRKEKKRDRKAISKGLFYKNASWKTILPDEKALIVMMAMVRNTCWNNKRVQRKLYIYIYIYMSSIYQRDTVFGYIVSGWERCFSGLCNCPVWLETDNILTDAYQTTSAVSALLMLLHPNTVHQIPPSKHPRSVKSPLTHHINSDLVWEKCHLTHIQCRIATANIC